MIKMIYIWCSAKGNVDQAKLSVANFKNVFEQSKGLAHRDE